MIVDSPKRIIIKHKHITNMMRPFFERNFQFKQYIFWNILPIFEIDFDLKLVCTESF